MVAKLQTAEVVFITTPYWHSQTKHASFENHILIRLTHLRVLKSLHILCSNETVIQDVCSMLYRTGAGLWGIHFYIVNGAPLEENHGTPYSLPIQSHKTSAVLLFSYILFILRTVGDDGAISLAVRYNEVECKGGSCEPSSIHVCSLRSVV